MFYKPIISIIIPCFNVENFITSCIESIINQQVDSCLYEVICIDDCSKDKTYEKISQIILNRENFFLIKHDENKKQGGARNTGLNFSRGKYIWFVDSDDFIEVDSIKKLLNYCNFDDFDILQFNYNKVSINSDFLYKKNNVEISNVVTGIQFAESLGNNFLHNYDLSVCTRLIKSDYLKINNIKFIENTVLEDLEFSLRTLLLCNRVKSISDSFYNYRENINSTMNFTMVVLKPITLFETCFKVGYNLFVLSEEIKVVDSKIAAIIKESAIWRINQFTKPFLKYDIENKNSFLNILEDNNDLYSNVYKFLNSRNKFLVSNSIISIVVTYIINRIIKIFLNKKL